MERDLENQNAVEEEYLQAKGDGKSDYTTPRSTRLACRTHEDSAHAVSAKKIISLNRKSVKEKDKQVLKQKPFNKLAQVPLNS